MKAQITKTFRFEASHHLLNHDGKCRNPHGHSYRVAVICSGRVEAQEGHPKEGMVVDFADIKKIWKRYLEPLLDHQDLNDTLGAVVTVTTAECIAGFICRVFHDSNIPVTAVEVWETETSSARVEWTEEWANGSSR